MLTHSNHLGLLTPLFFSGMNLVEKFTYKYVVCDSIIISWFTYVRFICLQQTVHCDTCNVHYLHYMISYRLWFGAIRWKYECNGRCRCRWACTSACVWQTQNDKVEMAYGIEIMSYMLPFSYLINNNNYDLKWGEEICVLQVIHFNDS